MDNVSKILPEESIIAGYVWGCGWYGIQMKHRIV
jgi:hypothetical protein